MQSKLNFPSIQTGQLSGKLLKLKHALLTVQPTTTDIESLFSVTGKIVTPIRNRLSDKMLNALIFLKCYFSNSYY